MGRDCQFLEGSVDDHGGKTGGGLHGSQSRAWFETYWNEIKGFSKAYLSTIKKGKNQGGPYIKMADKSYDAVVIGGGHHGTTIAPYLAKAGLSKVGVFETVGSSGRRRRHRRRAGAGFSE